MNKKVSLGAAIAFALLVAAAVFVITGVYTQAEDNQILTALSERQAQYTKFSQIDTEIRQRYYGANDMVETELQDSISQGYLAGIGDPNATYYSAERYSLLTQDDSDTAGNIGTAQRVNTEGYIEITEVYPNSPAELASITTGSMIIKIDDVEINRDNSTNMLASINGPEGTQITLTLRNPSGDESIIPLVRRLVSVPTVYWQLVPDTTVAYVRIINFDENTANQFNRYIQDMQALGATSMIIDLRDNVGYEMEHAVRVLDRLLPESKLVVGVYKDGTEEEYGSSDSGALGWPLTVIVNERTTGISELFAQTLKDVGNYKVVGATTAGRAVRLETVELEDGSAIEFTVAVYKSPSGKIYNGAGLMPDYEVALKDENWPKLGFANDPQIIKALEIIRGHVNN